MDLGLQDCKSALFLTMTEKLSFSALEKFLIQNLLFPKILDNWGNSVGGLLSHTTVMQFSLT